MANKLSGKDYQEIKNETLYVFVFNRNGTREYIRGGINYKKAIEEVVYQTAIGRVCCVLPSRFVRAGKFHCNTLKEFNKCVKRTMSRTDVWE